jgi:hypothetical protein
MALVLKDRVKVTSTTTGTGTLTLAGASTGYQSFAAIGDGNTTYYALTDPATGDWEVGIGTYTSSGTTLSRTTILSSSNAGSVVDLQAGTKEVFCVYPAEKAVYEEANGETLIDGGPITVIGSGVTSIPSLPAELGKFIGNANLFAQIYCLNQNDGSSASADFVAYNDLTTDGYTNFIDMGINSSNYTSVDYPIFTPGSGYLFHDGDHLFIGTATSAKDVVIFTGGVDTPNEAIRVLGTDQTVQLVGDLEVGGTLTVTGAAEFESTVLLDADPTLALQAATKQYVDNLVAAGIHFHEPVEYSTAAALPNSPTYNNGTAGVGATLTAGANAALVIDGVTLTSPTDNGTRVLVQNQASGFQNGIYVVTEAGSGGAAWVLTRASDADTYEIASPDGLSEGSTVYTSSGLTNAGSTFSCNTTGTITFGTTAITFTLISSAVTYIVQSPLDLTGNTLSLAGTVAATNGGTGTNTVTTGDLLYGSASNTWSKLAAGTAYKSLVMNAGGTNVEWNAVALNQSGAVSGTLPATSGGTGQSGYATGDTLYSSATDTLAKLAGNTTITPKYLRQVGTGAVSQAPSWDTIAAGDITSGTLAVARGGTNLGSYTTGDLLYASGTTTLAALADVATGNVLLSGGTNTAPSYGKVGLGTHISGTLAVGNGGTGVTTLSGIAFGNGTSAFTAATASEIVGAIGATAVTNATNATNATTAASCSGNAATATILQTARTINGTSFNGSANITVTANTTNTLTRGSYLTGSNFNGSVATTWAVDASVANAADKVVVRDGSGNFTANLITTQGRQDNYGVTTNAGTVAGIQGGTSNGTLASPTQSLNGDVLYKIAALGNIGGAGQWTGGSAIEFVATENITSFNRGTNVVIKAIPAGGSFTSSLVWNGATLVANGTTLTGNTGTVTSVATGSGLTGGPITSTGTVSLATAYGDTVNPYASKTANTFLAAPNGTAGVPTFRAIVGADIPTLNQNTTGSSGSCTGNAATATTLQTARTINGTSFNGSANITITANTTNALTLGTGLTGSSFNGSGTVTATVSYGTTAGTACQGNDSRLSNSRQATNTNTQLASLGVGTAASGTAGEIRATNNVTAYYSDERLKTKIGDIENALDKVKQIETMVYHANETAVALGYDASVIEVGVTAQSVQRVQPQVVAPAPIDDKYLTVRYERLVPLLIEAIKELEAQVAELKAK